VSDQNPSMKSPDRDFVFQLYRNSLVGATHRHRVWLCGCACVFKFTKRTQAASGTWLLCVTSEILSFAVTSNQP
jgi:hypothetical protein